VRASYRSNILWIIVFGVLLAVAEYSLAIQSARHEPNGDPEFGAGSTAASSESGTDSGDSRILR
jgi:hypothetical protein